MDGNRFEGEWRDGDVVLQRGNGTYVGQVQPESASEKLPAHAPSKTRPPNSKGVGVVPHGRGVFTCTKGHGKGGRYEGEFRDGKQHGRGLAIFESGKWYEGEFRDGEPYGRGVFKFKSGRRYEGEYRDGWRHGRGVCMSADGGGYEGEWHNGERHGRGAIWAADGRVFDGDWASGFPLAGTAMSADGALSRVTYDGRTGAWKGWDISARTPWGRVKEGRPPRGGGGEWIGRVMDGRGTQYAGGLRWLRQHGPGELTEGGVRFRVDYDADGAATLADGDAMPAPSRKEVRPVGEWGLTVSYGGGV